MKRVPLQHASHYSSFSVETLLVCDQLVAVLKILHSNEFLCRALGLDTLENIIGMSINYV